MSNKTEQIAEMYRNFANSTVGKHLMESVAKEADQTRRNASKSQVAAYGDLRFADGIEWVIAHIRQQQSLDKMGGNK
jgi:hypothetical protein